MLKLQCCQQWRCQQDACSQFHKDWRTATICNFNEYYSSITVVKYSPLCKILLKMKEIFSKNLQHSLGIHKRSFRNSLPPALVPPTGRGQASFAYHKTFITEQTQKNPIFFPFSHEIGFSYT